MTRKCHESQTVDQPTAPRGRNTEHQGSHTLWKSWKTLKIAKSFMHGKIMEFEKKSEKSWNFVK